MSWIASPSHLLLTARSWQLQLPTQLQIVAWTFAIVTKIVILILYCVVENVHQMENYICVICVAYHHLYCGLRLQFSGQFCLSASRNRIAVIIKRKVMLRGLSGSSHTHARPAWGAVTKLSLVTDVSLCGDDVRGPIKVADQCLEARGAPAQISDWDQPPCCQTKARSCLVSPLAATLPGHSAARCVATRTTRHGSYFYTFKTNINTCSDVSFI